MKYPEHLLKLMAVLKKLPGVGGKTAERFAFHLLHWPEEKLLEMAEILKDTKNKLRNCFECGNLLDDQPCSLCHGTGRNREILCVVASVKDIFTIEQTREYKGLYHIIDTLLSPIHGQIVSTKSIERLRERIQTLQIKEMIIAFDSTLEGDATALYLKKELEDFDLLISRLGSGIPLGSSLDYIDGGTLGRALAYRRSY